MIARSAKTVFRVAGEVAGHEADLDDRAQSELEDAVVDAVDAGEVVDRLAVDLAVDAEIVVEDRVGTHRPHAELVVGEAQRVGELVADVPAARADARGRAATGVRSRSSDATAGAAPRVGAASTRRGTRRRRRRAGVACSGALVGCPWSSTALTAATVYHARCPGVPVVSVSGGCGTGRTHGSPISNGMYSPSAWSGAADQVAGGALDRLPVERDLARPGRPRESRRRVERGRPSPSRRAAAPRGPLLPAASGARPGASPLTSGPWWRCRG